MSVQSGDDDYEIDPAVDLPPPPQLPYPRPAGSGVPVSAVPATFHVPDEDGETNGPGSTNERDEPSGSAGPAEPHDENGEHAELPDLESLLHMAQGLDPEGLSAIDAMATIHSRWRRAWAETGAFTDEETFRLVVILVAVSAGGLRSLS